MAKPAPVTPGTVERFARPMSVLAGAMFVWKMVRRSCLLSLRQQLNDLAGRFFRHQSGDAYEQAKKYLGDRCARRARQLRAGSTPGGDRFVLSLGDGEEVTDEYRGATVWWYSVPAPLRRQDAGRTYRLVFHRRHRELVVSSYLPHVCREGRAVIVANRRRKLFTNSGERYSGRSIWRHVAFEHPSTFETLAMDPAKKKDIMDDLDAFRNGKEYYARVGKAWKRGYLLHGPPGTGKSTMIAAMANYLDYDIYDVELTSVYANADLRRMFIQTTSKSIIVIEDIDCSLDLTGKRKKKKHPAPSDWKASKVRLSGMLNFIDSLWSACGGERAIVFTTNHAEMLDPALIWRGRMDKHIEMSYCCFEVFRFLAKNYLAVDTHPLFDDVRVLLREVNITPASAPLL
uniref:AAA+ ATPase domain-containing protein n=1 Tax=Setaria italica TaxID=4555 RepID=K3ZZI7_SETIT